MAFLNVDNDFWERALKLFDRTRSSFEDDVQTVREWIKTQQHLPEITNDAIIRNFLILNKCSVEKTKQKIDMYYTIRTLIPDFYEEANPRLPVFQEYMDLAYCVAHPVPTKEMYRVIFFKMRVSNKCAPRFGAIQIFNIGEVRLTEDCMMGDVFIYDMKNTTLEDVLKFTPSLFVKLATIYKNVFSQRLKALHIINSAPYVSHVMPLLKLVLKPKLYQRIQIHQDSEVLNEILSKDALPKDYGGDGPSLKEVTEMWREKFREYQSRFDQLDKLRVDENLRPEKLNNDELLGFYGNFKKLELD